MDSYVNDWNTLFTRCLQHRVRPELFETLAQKLHARSPIPGRYVAELLVRPTKGRVAGPDVLDPLLPGYLDRLLSKGITDASETLAAVFAWSKDKPPAEKPNEVDGGGKTLNRQQRNSSQLDEIILQRIARAFASGERPHDHPDARRCLSVVTKWMSAAVEIHNKDAVLQAMRGNVDSAQIPRIISRDSLGQLVVMMLEHTKVVQVLNSPKFRKSGRKELAHALSAFIPFLAQISINTSDRLGILQKTHDLIEVPVDDIIGDKEANDHAVATMQLQTVSELPMVNSRAGLFIFLHALLVGRPLTDDTTILAYLSNRYKGDVQSSIVDLITAAFDLLSSRLNRTDSSVEVFNFKTFLVNKVPTLVAVLATSMFETLTPEFCINQALGNIDPNAFPAFSQTFDLTGGHSNLADVKQDFLFACALHQLIPIESIERLLGEQPMAQLPAGGRYTKDQLVTQCSANPERVEQLLNEAERMEGNSGAIVAAVVEVTRHLCSSKDTMSLKTVCNGLSRRLQTLDIILQYTSPSSILQPLCHVLDSWRYEEDQGEYQPVYDEFGAILLLVLTFVHRYSLTEQELGLSNDSFVAKLLERGHLSIMTADLTAEQNKHLTCWVKGLFGNDPVDSVLSTCGPQDFYLLVPTLLSHTAMACAREVIPWEAIKTGLEYLLETFLLPSLVGALTWMSGRAVQRLGRETGVILQMFQKLIRPSSISGDAQAMHGTILSIVSARLDRTFRVLQEVRYPTKEIDPLVKRLEPHLGFQRTSYSSVTELENWTRHNDLCHTLRTCMRQLVAWSSSAPTMVMSTPDYTHRLLIMAQKFQGPRKVLRAIIEEVKAQTIANTPETAACVLDVAVALICAPTEKNSPLSVEWIASPVPSPSVPRTQPNLRDMLKIEYEEAADILTSDTATAEAIVRLHRRVELQLTITTLPDLTAATIIPNMQLSVDDAVAAVAGGANQTGGLDAMDLTGDTNSLMAGLGDLGGDLTSNGGADNTGGLGDLGDLGDMNGMDGMDDVFGDLEDFGDMDMEF